MLYISVVDDQLKNYCKNCEFSFVEDCKDAAVEVVSNIVGNNDDSKWQQFTSCKYLKNDPTLPRVSNIKCTNNLCTATKNEVIYIKYDNVNMKYLYYCCHCDHFWR